MSPDTSGTAGPGKAGKVGVKSKPKVKMAKRRRVVHPPSELLLLTSRSTVKHLQVAAEEAFRQVYCMFDKFKVTRPPFFAWSGCCSKEHLCSSPKTMSAGAAD